MIATYEISGSSPTVRATSARSLLAQAEAKIDAELVRQFNAGGEPAFVEIVARYRERLFAIAYTMLRNHADAEEVAQDAFLRAHRGLAKFRGDSSLATWLHRIALNLSRNRYWHSVRRGRHTNDSLDVPIGENQSATFADLIASSEAGPARTVMADEFAALVATCMEQLGERQRELTRPNARIEFSGHPEVSSSSGPARAGPRGRSPGSGVRPPSQDSAEVSAAGTT